MANYKILFLDIDGTILKHDGTMEESTKDAIKQVKEKGIEVFLATGRPVHEIDDVAEELNVHSFIGFNGAYAIHNDKEVLNEPMNPAMVDQFLEIADTHDHKMVLYTSGKNLFTSLEARIVGNFINTFQFQKNEILTQHHSKDNVLGVTVMNVADDKLSLYEQNDLVHLSQVNVDGLRECYDVIRDSVSKGLAVETILNLLNLHKDDAIAFGDGMNDKEMLQAVGTSFAMGNAHPDLFPYASRKTTTVTNSGIFNGLHSLGLVD